MSDTSITILKALASISSLCMCLSPAPSVHRVFKTQAVSDVSVIPLVSLWAACHVWMLYGLLAGNLFPIFFTYILGDVFAVLFIIIYYRVTNEKRYVAKVAGGVGAFLLLLTLYTILGRAGVTHQTPHQVARTVGFVGICVSVILYASPFETIKQVVRTKSAASIPAVMCSVGTVSNSLWVIYGLVDFDLFVVVPNVLCVALGVVQIVLYLVYRPRSDSQWKRDTTKFERTPAPSYSPTELLTPAGDINIAMGSSEDYVIVISPVSSVI